jgi:acyl-CoA synthetase (NDP forming)
MSSNSVVEGFRDLQALLKPRSIAVIGASDQPGNLGGVAVRLMAKFGYAGEIWPINPGRENVGGRRCFRSLADLPGPADLAIIATSAASVSSIVRDCVAAGTRYGIAWAGGFAEVGGDGATLQADLVAVCRHTGFTLVGPNCIGIVNSAERMTATFASFLIEANSLSVGSIAMVSQSGGIATMAQALAQASGAGFRYMISSGNEAILSTADYVHALANDIGTKVIAVYVEGIRDGKRFLEAVATARRAGKPVVVLKGGLTAASARAAAAHTGAFTGEGRVWRAVARDAGIICVKSLEELLDVALYLASVDVDRLPRGKSIATISFGGGNGVLSADQCVLHGLEMAKFAPTTIEALRPLLPPIAAIENPIDLTPATFNQDQWFSNLGRVLDLVADDPAVDTVVCQFGPMARHGIETARELEMFRGRTKKALCVAWPLSPSGVDEALAGARFHVFREYERGLAVVGKVAVEPSAVHERPEPTVPAIGRWGPALGNIASGTVISEHECHRVLGSMGVHVAPGEFATDAAAAGVAAKRIGFPVAMKGITPKVTHRAAAGLLALNLSSDSDVSIAHATLTERAIAAGTPLDGVYVQRMVKGGIEIIVSAFRDPIFGVMVSVGAGGGLTEVIDDVVLARAPFDAATAKRLVGRLRIVRAALKIDPGVQQDVLAEFVSGFSEIAASAPWSQFTIELNPVKWTPGTVVAVDGLILIEAS